MCHQQGYNNLLRVSGYSQKRLLASSCLSVLPSVCPTVYVYQLVSHPTDFYEIWYWRLELKSVENIQACLKYRAVFMTNKIPFFLFQTFAVFCMLYVFFCVIPRRLNFISRRFGTLSVPSS
jgi:hypothetical protein